MKKQGSYLIDSKEFMGEKEQIDVEDEHFEKLMFIYELALKEIENKIRTIQEQYQFFQMDNPIEHITSRIKSPDSIMNKMQKKGYELTYRELIENINDIAGIRIICSFKTDIHKMIEMMESLNGVKILKRKNYMDSPKKSGYSSYHLIISVPVNLFKEIIYVKVEVQIRTMAMDFWSSLEHKINYKNELQNSNSVSKELVKCAKMIDRIDNKMLKLNQEANQIMTLK